MFDKVGENDTLSELWIPGSQLSGLLRTSFWRGWGSRLTENDLTRRLFGAMLRRIERLPVPTG